MTTPNDPAAALAEAVRAHIFCGDQIDGMTRRLNAVIDALEAYEEAAKAAPAKTDPQQQLIAAHQMAKDFRAAWDAKDEDTFWEKFEEACLSLTAYEAAKAAEGERASGIPR